MTNQQASNRSAYDSKGGTENEYDKVQFISWEIYTGPIYNANNVAVDYAGLRSEGVDERRTDIAAQCRDIDARVRISDKAINKAEEESEKNDTTLKVFMAPEFLYRGAGGAYLHDLLNGHPPAEFGLKKPHDQNWLGLFGSLQNIVSDDKFKHWIFVFGTAISATFQTKFPTPGCASFLLPKSLRKGPRVDPGVTAEIYNTALVQRGGKDNREANYASRKLYKSGIDFIKTQPGLHSDGSVEHLDAQGDVTIDNHRKEGGAVFYVGGVRTKGGPLAVGLEVCLDHSMERIKQANAKVKLQLVPSGGMSLKDASILLLDDKSYAFNCDGLTDTPRSLGSHTQIWRGPSPYKQKYEGSSGKPGNGKVFPIPDSDGSEKLWNSGNGHEGAGHVRLIDPLEL